MAFEPVEVNAARCRTCPTCCRAAEPVARGPVLREDRGMTWQYLWPFSDYRNAASGTELERAAAFRHNRRLARGLPAYLNRWGVICCVLLTASQISPAALAPLIGIAFTLALCLTLHIAHVYLLFSWHSIRQ
jgi:hypothetical protein